MHKQQYIIGIDGLRALAVLSVILFHLNPTFLPGGFAGVDVFFVISGYVVSSSLVQHAGIPFKDFISGFYARRIIRILPALIAFVLVANLILTLFVPTSWLSSTSIKTALFSLFGFGNYALIWFNDGYFSPRVEYNGFTHTWSLGVEEQFYLLFPLIMFLWLKYKEKQNYLGILVNWLLVILFFISLYYSYIETSHNPDKAYYLLPSRFWELAIGALLLKLHLKNIMIPKSINVQRLFLITGMILLAIGLIYSDKNSFPYPWAIVSVVGTALLISGILFTPDKKSIIQSFLESKPIVQIGKISYSLYLWHWFIFVLFRWTVSLEKAQYMILALILTFIFANISYYFIEKPIRDKKRILKFTNKKIIISGLLATCMAFATSAAIYKSQKYISLSVTKDKKTWYPHSYPGYPKTNSEINKNIFSDRKLFVLGDSHAGAYSTMLQMLSDEYGVEIIKFSKGGCGIGNLLRSVDACKQETDAFLAKVESSANPNDIIFFPSLKMTRFSDEWAQYTDEEIEKAQHGKEALKERKIALKETEEVFKKIEKLKMHIIIDAPLPLFKAPPFRCSDWFNQSNPICKAGFDIEKKILLEHAKPALIAINTLTNEFSNLKIWDPLPILCPTEVCSAYDKEEPLFFDADHLSAYGNRKLYPSFSSFIKQIWTK